MKLSPREKKFVAAALVAGTLFACTEFLVLPWSEKNIGSQETLRLKQKALRRERELAISAPQIRAQTAALEGRLTDEEHRLLSAPDANQAGAQLQEWLVRQATEQHLNVVRSEFLPSSPVAESYVLIPVRIELNGRITQIVQFLTAALQGERVASLDELQIGDVGVIDKEKMVRCSVIVSSLMRRTN